MSENNTGRVGALIRRERLARDWSLKGLAHGICAVSYLSKIERGEADPSPEVTDALLERLGIAWHDDEAFLARARDVLDRGYDALLSFDEPAFPALRAELADLAADLATSPLAAQAKLLEGLLAKPARPVEPELEAYESGEKNYVPAVDLLRQAYELAAREGRARVMLSAKVCLGNCYCNQLDFENMEAEYRVAARLARALGEKDLLRTISYNTASAHAECGHFERAYAFFSTLDDPSALDLHKLAVCCEGLERRDEALAVLDRVPQARREPRTEVGEDLPGEFCDLVRFRLEHPDYLRCPEYGKALLAVFGRCRAELPIGFAAFHLPWVLEWHTANRQYRAAFELERDFPLKLPVVVEYDGVSGVQ